MTAITAKAKALAIAAAIVVLGVSAVRVSDARAGDPVKVGVLLSLSGATAPFGIPERDVVKILAEKYNAAGGINGHKLDLIYFDDQSNPTEAARGAVKLIREDHVQVIIGAATGSGTLAMMPILAQAKIPALAPVSTQSVTSHEHPFYPWVFRTSTASAITIQALVQKAIFKSGRKRVAIMYQEDAYGKDESEIAQKLIKEHGGIDVVAVASAPITAIDLSAAATRIRNTDPDIVLLLTSAPSLGGAFARAAQQANLKAPIIGSLSLNQRPFVDAAGPAGEGIMSVSLGNWDQPSKKQAELGDLLRAHGKQPAGYAELIGSTTIIALAEALRHIDGPVTGQKIRDALENICGFTGTYVDGPLCYSKEQHDAFGPDTVNVVKIHDGKWENTNF